MRDWRKGQRKRWWEGQGDTTGTQDRNRKKEDGQERQFRRQWVRPKVRDEIHTVKSLENETSLGEKI